MKKIVMSLAVIMGLGMTQINAQKISGGIKADANLSNFILSDMGNAESKMSIGATLGGFAKFDIVENFAIQPELLFHFKSSKMDIILENDYQYWGAEIPIYAMGQWNLANDSRIYAGVGPYVGLGFSAKYKDGDIDLYEKSKITDKAMRQRFDFGFGATVGYEFDFGLQINAAYKIGVIDNLDAGKDNATMLPQTVSLGVGYRF